MLDSRIIDEAYNEINILQIKEEIDSPKEEIKLDPKFERIKKLVSDIQNMIYRIQDSYTDEYGKEDNDLRDEMKKSLNKTMYKMVDRLKDILENNEEKKDEGEEKKDEGEEKKEEGEEKKDEGEEKKDEDKEEEKKEEESNLFKLFPTESVISPQGKEYKIIEVNEHKSLIEDNSGDKFKVDTNILKMWKNK